MFTQNIERLSGLEHLPKRGGYILAANHVDFLDGFYLIAVVGTHRKIPVYFLTKSNTYRWTSVTVKIPTKQRGAIVDFAVTYLQRGHVICNFPEGQRNNTNKLLPGKTGTVRMAMAAGVPVVPVGITCSAGRNMAQSMYYLFSQRHPVHIAFGKPLNFTMPENGKITNELLADHTATLMRAIAPLAGKRV